MTVLSPAKPKQSIAGFPLTGRYSHTSLLLDFAEWSADLPWVRSRIDELRCSEDFVDLFGDLIVLNRSKARWSDHPDARAILMRHCETLMTAWDNTLSTCPDRAQLTLEYLIDALKRFEQQTKTH